MDCHKFQTNIVSNEHSYKLTAQFRELLPVISVTKSDVSEEKRPSVPNSKAR